MRRRVMESKGTQQTGYADWAKTVLLNYPKNPKFQKNGDVVNVYYEEERIAEYDFKRGIGTVILDENHSLKEIGRLKNFEEFDLDTLLQK